MAHYLDWEDIYRAEERQADQDIEDGIRADRALKTGDGPPPNAEHAKRFICAHCLKPLGTAPAEGIDDEIFHPGCAWAVRRFRKARAEAHEEHAEAYLEERDGDFRPDG